MSRRQRQSRRRPAGQRCEGLKHPYNSGHRVCRSRPRDKGQYCIPHHCRCQSRRVPLCWRTHIHQKHSIPLVHSAISPTRSSRSCPGDGCTKPHDKAVPHTCRRDTPLPDRSSPGIGSRRLLTHNSHWPQIPSRVSKGTTNLPNVPVLRLPNCSE